MERAAESLVRGMPVAAGLFVLWVTLTHLFAFDDPVAIVSNPLIDGSRSWIDALTHDFWGERRGFEHIASWRPLTLWSLRLDRLIGGGQPWVFHLTNGLLHLAIVVSVGHLASRLSWEALPRLWLGLSVALLPAFAEGLASIVGRGDLLAALFGLWGIALVRQRPRLALVALSLALLSKETAVVYAITAGLWSLASGARGPFLMLGGLGALWYTLRSSVVGHLGGEIPAIDNPLVLMSFDERLVASMGIVGRYVSWSLGAQPVPADLAAGVTHSGGLALLGSVSLLALLGLVGWAYTRSSTVFIGACLALVSLLLLSNLVFALPTPAAGRLAYHPGLGLCLASAALLSGLVRGGRWSLASHGLAFGLLLVGVPSGLQTMAAWERDVTLFEASVAIEPMSARAQTNLAKHYMDAGRYAEARPHLDAALKAAPNYPLALLNLSALLERMEPGGEQAWRLAEGAVTHSSRPDKALANLCALALGRPALKAQVVLEHCQRAQAALPGAPEVMTNLARAAQRAGRLDESEAAFSRALAAHPEHPFVLGHWVGHLVKVGRTEEAVMVQRGVVLQPGAPPSAMKNLVALLLKLAGERAAGGQGREACELAQEATRLVPGVRAVAARAHALCGTP